MPLKLKTAPASEPITLANAKIKLGIESGDTSADTTIGWMIPAARQWVENRLGRALITQTWTLYSDGFDSMIYLPKGHIQSVTHIKYTDSTGTPVTVDSADYQLDLVSEPARIMPSVSAGSWPSVESNRLNSVEIEYITGYGAAADIPGDIIEALYRIVGHWVNNQSAIEQGVTITRVPFAVDQMLQPYRLYSFGEY